MATDDLEHGYNEFLKRITVVTFAQVKFVVADGTRDVELGVYLFFKISSFIVLLQVFGIFLLVR